MAFIKVENFLERFSKFAKAEDIEKKTISVIKRKFPKPDLGIKVKNGIIYVSNLNQAFKNEIFLRKEEILKELKDDLGRKAPREINFQKF